MPIKLHMEKALVWTDEVEETALNQISNLTTLPFIHKHVAVMPDVHAGCGSTIGSVIPTKGAIIPAAVGVDIGCGMVAQKLDLKAHDLPDSLHTMRYEIEALIPHGRSNNGKAKTDKGGWEGVPPEDVITEWEAMEYDPRFHAVEKALRPNTNSWNHLGTLGTGNHFIEICLDENDNVWIMLHSGSRGIGNRIGQHYIELAKKDMQKYFINLPDKDLAYFPEGSEHFDDYISAMLWAQNYASINRSLMLKRVKLAMSAVLGKYLRVKEQAINCHHNYAERENHFGANVWVTRKGAVRARENDLGIIPGSMGAKSFIVRGLGNKSSFSSCSHGAGRTMSRTAARAKYDASDLEAATAGIECRKDADVVDEIPHAYKDIDQVMDNQSDLVEIVATLKQVVNVKG